MYEAYSAAADKEMPDVALKCVEGGVVLLVEDIKKSEIPELFRDTVRIGEYGGGSGAELLQQSSEVMEHGSVTQLAEGIRKIVSALAACG